MKFDERRWEPVDDAVVTEVIRKALRDLHWRDAKNGAGQDRLRKLSGLLSFSRIRAIQSVAKGIVTTEAKEFDNHPDLLNVSNGVVNLRDGTLRQHSPELMFTKVAPIDYVPGATCPDWDQALSALPGGKDTEAWLQVRLGQGLTGHPVSDDRLVVLKGSGSNGKTTIVDGVREALGGDYAVTLPERVLLARNGDHPTELMVLRGARLALMEEFPELGHLNVKRLKDLHGVGDMSARYCGRDSVSWKATHTIFVTTNYLPRVDESDDGTWRRLVLVDFPYRYRRAGEEIKTAFDRTGDPNLRRRLRHGRRQHEAVLAWLVAGAVKWYGNGQVMPEDPKCIREATRAWRKGSDLLLRYISDRLVFDSQTHVMSTELFANFTEWLKTNGHHQWSDQNFSARLSQHSEALDRGVQKLRVRQGKAGLSRNLPQGGPGVTPQRYEAWLGIRFRTDDDDKPEENSDDLG